MKARVSYRRTQWGAGPHVTLSIWVNGEHAGVIAVRNEDPDERDVLDVLQRALESAGATNDFTPPQGRHG